MNENEQTAVTAEVQNVPAQAEIPGNDTAQQENPGNDTAQQENPGNDTAQAEIPQNGIPQTEHAQDGIPQDESATMQAAVPQVQGKEPVGRNSETAGAENTVGKTEMQNQNIGADTVATPETSPEGSVPTFSEKIMEESLRKGLKATLTAEAEAENAAPNTETKSVDGGTNWNQTTGVSAGKENDSLEGENKEPSDSKPETMRSVRNYEAEWKELAEAHPEVIGTTLPEDVFQACIKSDQPPLRVYETMMLKKMRDEVERLKQENDRLKQNHSNAQRAPVTGTLEGGATGVKEEDAFIAAFNRYR